MSASSSSSSWDDDVLQVAEYSIRLVQEEEQIGRAAAVRLLLAEGVGKWGCPEGRLADRADWEREILDYLRGC